MTIQDDAAWINARWEHLTDSRLIGTPRPWRQPPTKPANPEQLEHTTSPTPAPLHLDTHDLIHHILKRTRHLAVVTAAELEHHQVLAYLQHHRSTDPGDELDYILRHHDKTSTETQTNAVRVIHRVRARMAEHFSEVLDGQALAADCPWCKRPGLRIRLIGPEHALQPVVLCEHEGCNPQPAECGKWWRGHPAWPFHEWEWLAQRIGA